MPRAKWEYYAAELPIEKLKESIVPGSVDNPEAWKDADFAFLREIKRLRFDSVLDFGCGLGRNITPLTKVFQHVDGYDLPAMIQRLKENEAGVYNSARIMSSDWPVFRKRRYDLIVSELVFQHIFEMELITYLHDVAAMSPYLWLLTRSWNDDYRKNNMKIINDTGLFTAEYIRVSPARVLGAEPVLTDAGLRDALQKLMNDDSDFHCTMLLRSNRYEKQGGPSAGEPGHGIGQPLGERELEILEALARENLAREKPRDEKEETLYDEGVLRDNIFFANIIYDRTIPGKAESNRALAGRFLALVKRLISRLGGWYVDPALENQREFNACIAQAAREMMNYLDDIKATEKNTDELMYRNLELIRENIMIINRYLARLSPEFHDEITRLHETGDSRGPDDPTQSHG